MIDLIWCYLLHPKKISKPEELATGEQSLPIDWKAVVSAYICVWLILWLWQSSHFNVLSHQLHPSLSPKFRLHGDGCETSAHRPANSRTVINGVLAILRSQGFAWADISLNEPFSWTSSAQHPPNLNSLRCFSKFPFLLTEPPSYIPQGWGASSGPPGQVMLYATFFQPRIWDAASLPCPSLVAGWQWELCALLPLPRPQWVYVWVPHYPLTWHH